MSARLENTAEELSDLVGATIEVVWIEQADGEYDFDKIRFRVRYRDGFGVNGSDAGEYEIWQDIEGNGPGYVAFIGPSSTGRS